MSTYGKKLWVPVVVGALGYFVDIYDLVLFSILRVPSLQALGVAKEDLLSVGVTLLNCQMSGMLVGGIAWGILGDKRGRLSVLFGSILLYSLANLANAYVTSVPSYAVFRFVAGFGLAGELGAAVTLVSEVLPREIRGYGTAIVAGVGLTGAIVAGLTGQHLPWRTAYVIGGCLGIGLLILRLGVLESRLFLSSKSKNIARGDLWMLFNNRRRFVKFLCCVGIGVPIWCVVGVLMTFAPEFAAALNIQGPVTAGYAILFCYTGISVGDLLSGSLSQFLRTRKGVVLYSILLVAALTVATLLSYGMSNKMFYAYAVLLGLATGYWAVFVTVAAESFGTNMRATVATSVPNIVRGTVVLITSSFRGLIGPFGIIGSALTVNLTCCLIGLLSLKALDETHSKDLDYFER